MDSDLSSDITSLAEDQAIQLRDMGVQIYAIGVNLGGISASLEILVSEPIEGYISYTSDFSQLQGMATNMMEVVSHDTGWYFRNTQTAKLFSPTLTQHRDDIGIMFEQGNSTSVGPPSLF